MKIQDMLLTRVGVLLVVVLLVSKAEVLVDNHRIELEEEEERERTTPTVAFDYGFVTRKRRYVSNSDLSHSILHFISCWFYQRSCFSQNHFEIRL